MADLQTSYMGIKLANPLICGASGLMSDIDNIVSMEKNGAAAVVYKSLFEEQIELERLQLDEMTEEYTERHAEMITPFPHMEHAGPLEHLLKLKKVKQGVSIPVIASLNALSPQTWLEYARKIEETGVDAIELNLFYVPGDTGPDGAGIEKDQLDIVSSVAKSLSIPVSVKLSSFYSNPLNLISKMDREGIKGVVLFNRFFQPDIDIDAEEQAFPFRLSSPGYHRLPLRFTGMLYGKINADICSSSGVFYGNDMIKLILAGASCIQCVSTLYKNGIGHIGSMLEDLDRWMKKKGYKNLKEFRGKLSSGKLKDPFAYHRAQYVDLLMGGKPVIKEGFRP